MKQVNSLSQADDYFLFLLYGNGLLGDRGVVPMPVLRRKPRRRRRSTNFITKTRTPYDADRVKPGCMSVLHTYMFIPFSAFFFVCLLLLTQGVKLKGTLLFCAVSDEEAGGEDGAK